MIHLKNRLFVAFFTAVLCQVLGVGGATAVQSPAQTPPSATAPAASNDKPHGPMPVVLTKPLDSKKLKEGEPVTARITAELHMRSGDTIPRDSKLIGHVTEAKARSKSDSQSALGIVFDKITTPNGKDMAVKGVIQAVGPAMQSNEPAPSGSIGPGMMAGRDQGMSAGTTPPPTPTPSQGPAPSTPMLNAQSKGVVGIRNLELGDNSVLISSGKEVRLDSGTQMIVLVEIE
jgi:hypothetical protein